MAEFFNVGQPGYYLLILIFVGCVAALFVFRNGKKRPATKAENLQKTYAIMTKELLDETPDEKLVNAVVANLMEKLPLRRPDPLITIPRLSHGRNAVYFCWMLCKEIEHNGVEAILKKPASRFVDVGIEGLVTVGANTTADAVRAFVTPAEDVETEENTEIDPVAAVLSAIETENPLALCVEYIRHNPEEFLDT